MNDDLHHLAAAYALDALDDRERAQFEAHYPTCEICRREVEEFRETAGRLASAAATTPPADLRDSVMDEIARTRQRSPLADDRPIRRPAYLRPAMLAAAAVLVLVVGAVVLVALAGGRSPVEEVLAAPDAVVTTLATTPDGTGGSFQVVWSASSGRAAVIANDLTDPGPGRVYELWAIVDETPVPAGSFSPDSGSLRTTTNLDVVPAAWGVTVEPAGGSTVPTTPIVFFAEL